jgi:hypothetical protein
MTEPATRAPGMRRIGDPRDIDVMAFELEKEDVMKFKPIYEALHQFLGEEGFAHPQSKNDQVEDLYWERWVPSGAKEQHIWWRVFKEINPYIRYYAEINWQTLNVTKAEVAYKNKKVSGERIDCIIRVRLFLQWDYHDRFKNSIGWKMKKVFFNRIYNEELQNQKHDLERFGLRMQRLVKYYFEMAGGEDHPVIFQPQMGWDTRSNFCISHYIYCVALR